MKIEFDVQMNAKKLYDYSLYHTYRSFSGLLGTAMGALLILYFLSTGQILYLIFGIIVILYLPIALYLNAKKQMVSVQSYKEPLHFCISDEGMEVSQGEVKQLQEWEKVQKVVSTGQSIILYTGKTIATVIPREDMGEKTEEVIQTISRNVPPKRVKIRF